MQRYLEKRRRVRIFMYIRNINKIKTNNNMNRDIAIKYTFGTVAATLLIMNVCAFGVIIFNAIINII